ncbi:MAG TPA: histidine kinase N-terminal 7TM domain-containing protein [bacterium]|nr:histidine kinase N-terminal 7TM domain-containing protein [bacterium]
MNIWPITSLIPGLIHLFLAGYVFSKNYRKRSAMIFSLFAISLAIWSFSEFGHRIANTKEVANIWMKIGGIGWCFMPSLCFHFVMVFTRKHENSNKIMNYLGIYLPPAIIYYLFLTTNLIYIKEPVKKYFGYTAVPGQFVWLYAGYYTILYLLIFYLLIEVVHKEAGIKKKQAQPILVGSGIYILLSTTTNIILPESSILIPELGTFFSIIWAISVFYSMHQYQLFELEPSLEKHIKTPQKYELKEGQAYYVLEDEEKLYEIFYDKVVHGSHGLCITKYSSERIRNKYNISKTPILQLTYRDDRPNAASPADTDGIYSMVSKFINKTGRACILLDCYHEIQIVNGPLKGEELLTKIKDLCFNTGSNVLITVDASMLDSDLLAEFQII